MSAKIRKAMILAAGEGTRLRPLTLVIAKVLLPVRGVPLIHYTLSWLKSYGIQEVAINLYHLGDRVKDSLGDGSAFGMRIRYSREETLLGTAGGVKRVEDFFDGTFLVICGDVLTDFDLSAMTEFHRLKKAMATIALTRVPDPWEKGIIRMEDEGRIISFVEKPARGTEPGNLASGGVYILEKPVLDFVPGRGASDFAYDVFPALLKAKLPVYGYLLSPQDYLIDIGSADNYLKADEDVKSGRLRVTNSRHGNPREG